MRGKTVISRSAREPQPATSADIEQAINALTDEDNERIEQSALNRIARIGSAANGRSHGDLIQEAFFRILNGTRHWYKERVSFADCLIGVIWSVASAWAGHRKRNKEKPEYATPETVLSKTDDQGKCVSPFDSLRDPTPTVENEMIETEISAEQEAECKVLADKIEAAFEDDERATIIIMGFQDGMGGPEIREAFDFSEKEFRTTLRRVQRGAKKILDEHNGK